ncbi:hypothetical protein JW964_19675 [candidate division KSB1 bacterium]|nr:hypothetical protein [candidate division KSB1 bacterium]
MKENQQHLIAIVACFFLIFNSCQKKAIKSVTVPITLDHNRMLVEAEIQRLDSTWCKALLWIDTGNPDFFISEAFARELGIDLSEAKNKQTNEVVRSMEVSPPTGVRIGGMPLNFTNAKSIVMFEPKWLFSTMHIDANLPSTVLMHYRVIFDYPKLQLTLAEPGSLQPQGQRANASIHSRTGIVQIDAAIDDDSLSFALDNGASYSFTSDSLLKQIIQRHLDWPQHTGAIGCANIWGWWPEEPSWLMLRLPEMQWGPVTLGDVGMVGLPESFPLAKWYSRKTAYPVDGILGPNVFKAFRIEIDYVNNAVYFEKGATFDLHDMELVGLTLQPEADGSFQVIGVAQKNGKPVVEGIEAGDVLLQVETLKVTGATMGTVMDALRGKPGDIRSLLIVRNGKQFTIEAKVERFL